MSIIEFQQFLNDASAALANFANSETLKKVINSDFIVALVGSLAGAFAGAFAAQRIAERSKNRDELIREIRDTNAAIAVAYGIFNSLFALKKQHVHGLAQRFNADLTGVVEIKRKQKAGEILDTSKVYKFIADLQTLPVDWLPTDPLRSIVFERLSLVGRPLNLVLVLFQATNALRVSIEKRNKLIEGYAVEFADNNLGLTSKYFGLPYGGGHVNLDYPTTLGAISSHTDDGIYFSSLLCKDLRAHGIQLADKFRKQFRTQAPRVLEVDFASNLNLSLMPDESKYTDWNTVFVRRD